MTKKEITPKGSKCFRLNCKDGKEILDGLSISLIAAVSSAFLLNLDTIQSLLIQLSSDYLESNNFPLLIPFLTAIVTTLFIGVRRFLTDHSEQDAD